MAFCKPNFFIIGAPKCGTTSLAAWLAAHPRVYMSPIKEPSYFSTDIRHSRTWTEKHYEELFQDTTGNHLAIGEASTDYLFSKLAVPNILAYSPNARFIVLLRHPAELAYSLQQEDLFHLIEDVTDFEESWNLQSERERGKYIPAACTDHKFLLYGPRCLLGEQMERLYSQVREDRVHVLLLDDLRKDPRHEYLRVLRFLGVPDDGRIEFPVLNQAKVRRSRLLLRLAKTLGSLKLAMGFRKSRGYLNRFVKWNTRTTLRKPLRPEFQKQLDDYFASDIVKLGKLIGRDLTPWLLAKPKRP
jgi:hypothetical protein